MDEKLKRWRADGKHLPKILKDFHNQKEIFRTMHQMTGWNDKDDRDKFMPSSSRDITPVDGQIYTIDCFLWFMARHGYTLQKSRARDLEFDDLQTNVKLCEDARNKQFANLLMSAGKNQDES